MQPIVIDANCLKNFQEERVRGESGDYQEMIKFVISNSAIAIDNEGHARQEYYDCCRPSAVGLNLSDWISDQLVSKKIQMFKMNRSAEKNLKTLGVPKKDLKWPAIALGAAAEAIITEDIDLFEPKLKNGKSKSKEKAKEVGGRVSNFLKKKHSISVLTNKAFLIVYLS